jgi:hydrogenase maturation protein HypF
MNLTGFVRNTSAGVEIVVEGDAAELSSFFERLTAELPLGAELESDVVELIDSTGCNAFVIEKDDSDGPLAVRVPADAVVCKECLREVFDHGDRRHRYPITSCTRCGPRFSIIRAMPYDRAATTMAEFVLCPTCRNEYLSPVSRRFHAQTNACSVCGPYVWAVDAHGRREGVGDAAIRVAVAALRAGNIVALKGIGGYQLLVDATNYEAIERLRQRKHRATKPLAVLVSSHSIADSLAYVDEAARLMLESTANPIVLLAAKSHLLAANVHPQLNFVGLMLPTTPVHALIAHEFRRPLICTSGNIDGQPLVFRDDTAEKLLAGVCDVWLHHNRPIERPLDDSVVRLIAGRPVTIRLGRGFAPLPLRLPTERKILALGGHMKSAAAWSNGQQAVIGPHIGDLANLATRERFDEQLTAWQSLFRFAPDVLVHDEHPDYFTTRWAQQSGAPVMDIQHHHAHIVAGMLEHNWLDRTVLGVAWDGTGYGPDFTIWGGEFLQCTACDYTRVASLLPFALPGGERAIREPWRSALAVVASAVGEAHTRTMKFGDASAREIESLLALLGKPSWSPLTSSAGRLFDAVAHLVLGISHADFDGQAAMMLESIADPRGRGAYDLPLREGDPARLDWRPLIRKLLHDRENGIAPEVLAIRFHRGLARGIANVCGRLPDLPVVLSGGAFQNRLLTELVLEQLADGRQPLGLPGVIPVSDGGLAAGQLAIAAARLGNTPCA